METRAVKTNRVGQADVGLQQAVRAAFTGTVEEKNDWPLLLGGPTLGNKDLVFVIGTFHRDRSIEKSTLSAGARARNNHERENHKPNENNSIASHAIPLRNLTENLK